jgi:hypothetical protein
MEEPYNPCDDGFAAKVWECLRRNRIFRRALKKHRAPNATPPSVGTSFFVSERNKWARYALIHLVPSQAYPEKIYAKRQSKIDQPKFTEEEAWPTTSEDFRCHLELIHQERNRLLKPLLPPPFEIIWKLTKQTEPVSYKDVLAVWDWLAQEAHRAWEENLVLVVPKQVMDTNHKRRLIAEFTQLLSPPSADARWTKARGRLLGSWRKWRSFLLVESWERLGLARDEATNITAFECYDGVHFGRTDEQRLGNFRRDYRNVSRHKRFSKVEDDVRAIEACIASVYPDFNPKASG